MNPDIEKILKEYEKEFCEYLPYRNTEILCFKGIKQKNMNLIPTAREIKAFLSQALQTIQEKTREETIKEISKFLDYAYSKNFDQNIAIYQSFLDGMKKPLSHPSPNAKGGKK